MRRIFKSVAKFVIVLIVMTIICTIVWEFVGNRLYDCTDASGFDYWQPGNWVHGKALVVHQVVHHRSMSEPDTIKEGWSVTGVWCLWYVFVVLSLVVGVLLAPTPWIPRRRTGRVYEHTHAA